MCLRGVSVAHDGVCFAFVSKPPLPTIGFFRGGFGGGAPDFLVNLKFAGLAGLAGFGGRAGAALLLRSFDMGFRKMLFSPDFCAGPEDTFDGRGGTRGAGVGGASMSS